MFKYFILLISLFVLNSYSFTQGVGVNLNGAAPNNSSILDISSSDQGLLVPRLTLTSTTDITTITNGNVVSLLVFNTATIADVVPGYYYWNGSVWQTLGGDADADPTNEIELPTGGTNGQILSTDGSGNYTWVNDGSGTDNQDLSISGDILSLTNDGSTVDLSGLKDHDWYEVGGTTQADNINDNIFTQGNVGIGVIAPTAKLDVNGDIKYSGNASTVFEVTSTSDNILLNMNKLSTGLTNAQIVFDGYGAPVDQGQIRFFTKRDASNGGTGTLDHAMSIIDGGNVGIGTNSPTEKLDVMGSVKITDGTEAIGNILMSDATGKAHWENGAVKESSNGSYKQMCSGSTTPGVGWVQYGADGIYIDVNTSGCGFTSTPRYITSIQGGGNKWLLTGVTSVYSATATGFRIYLKYDNGNFALTPAYASASAYQINWIAIEN